jgi:hypothetical protein
VSICKWIFSRKRSNKLMLEPSIETLHEQGYKYRVCVERLTSFVDLRQQLRSPLKVLLVQA